jgi:formiminotetrahydrofolate cyclodeaminase
MAEQGYEYTPAQMRKIAESIEDLRQTVHDGAREDPEQYEKLADLTTAEKKEICRMLKIRQKDIDGIISIILDIYEQERLY